MAAGKRAGLWTWRRAAASGVPALQGAPPRRPTAPCAPRRPPLARSLPIPSATYRQQRQLSFKGGRRRAPPADGGGGSGGGGRRLRVEVDGLVQGAPCAGALTPRQVEEVLGELEEGAQRVVALALAARAARERAWRAPRVASLSLVVCDDAVIRAMNREHRSKDAPTDVLSFEIPDDPDFPVNLPVKLLGDVLISLDTAARQAAGRGHSLLDEARVLLVHGVLHLTGLDHERSEGEAAVMAAAEAAILQELGWRGQGLIEAAGEQAADDSEDTDSADGGDIGTGDAHAAVGALGGGGGRGGGDASTSGRADRGAATAAGTTSASATSRFRSSDVAMVCIDMDGTLLDSASRVQPRVAEALRAACASGVRVVLATGKARPAALAACAAAGLVGEGLVVWERGPGIFLQGLAVHGLGGVQLSDAALPLAVVEEAFRYSLDTGTPLCAFLGDECATLAMTPELEELHTRYYEPLAQVAPSLSALLAGPPVRKLLFMAPPHQVDGVLKPHWRGRLVGSGASPMQAVANMLEVVPEGVNKWAGVQVLLGHLGVDPGAIMAIGDGSNDLEMVAAAGLGVAMGNAVLEVKAAASVVVGTNDEGGVAEALERYVL